MNLKYGIAGLALTVALLAGCDSQQTAPAQPQATATPAPEPIAPPVPEVDTTPVVDPNPMSKPLPEGVVLKLAVHPLKDVTMPRKNGKRPGRRVEFEILEGDAEAALASIRASMLEAGFTVKSGPTTEGAMMREVFSKKNYGLVHVRVQSEAPKSGFQDPSAKGFAAMAW
jgi:hypothetical protein